MAKKTPSKSKTSVPFVEPSFEEGAKMVQSIIHSLNDGYDKLHTSTWVCLPKVIVDPRPRQDVITFVSEKQDLICVFTRGQGFRVNGEDIDITRVNDSSIVETAILTICDKFMKMSRDMAYYLINRVIPRMAQQEEHKKRLCRLDSEARALGYSLTKLGLPEGTCK